MTSKTDQRIPGTAPVPPQPTQDLLPCPFCGGSAKLDHLTAVDDWFVSCESCEVQQIANYTDYEAIKRWNARAVQRCWNEHITVVLEAALRAATPQPRGLIELLEAKREDVQDLLNLWDVDGHYTLSRFIEDLAELAAHTQGED